jgi:hypothetical protein
MFYKLYLYPIQQYLKLMVKLIHYKQTMKQLDF